MSDSTMKHNIQIKIANVNGKNAHLNKDFGRKPYGLRVGR